MSILPILVYGDPRLRQVAEPVAEVTQAVRDLAADMCETMYDAPGRGLAAPQVGQLVRMFVMDCHWKDSAEHAPGVMINPEIIEQSSETRDYDEGCLSIPGLLVPLTRPAEVAMRWTDLDGAPQSRRFDGFEAVCVQHEYDHLDGVLTLDRLSVEDRSEMEAALGASTE